MMPNCHQVHRLVAESYDHALPFVTRLKIRLHLLACDACTHFAGEMKLLRIAMRRLSRS
jgi:hypothetical protein